MREAVTDSHARFLYLIYYWINLQETLRKNFTTKKWKFSDKKHSDIFHISAQNINCGYSSEPPRRGGSNEYPQFIFWAEIRKIIYTPVNQIYNIKVLFKGVKII